VGVGSLTLTGNNSYTGGTTVSYGTLIGDTDSLQGSITNDAMLVFDQAGNGTYGGIIGGTGTVTKQGSGTLIMNGSNTYTGDTMVNAGTLIVGDTTHLGARIAGLVKVAPGATLGGSGHVHDAIVNGTIAPGNSIGTLNVDNNLIIDSG